MKELLLILLCLPMIGFGQLTYVPDDNFEQALINLGYDNVLDDDVLTSSIDTITYLDISYQNITDLTGIEDFLSLQHLNTSGNQLGYFDISNNINLTYLFCRDNDLSYINLSQNLNLWEFNARSNNLTELDVSNNINLGILVFDDNQVYSIDISNNYNLYYIGFQENNLQNLDVSNNPLLTAIDCWDNQITSLDLSGLFGLQHINCENNNLQSLDIRNGNNYILQSFFIANNPLLECINVDDVAWSNANWTVIDPQHYFSTNCPPSAIQEHSLNKKLLKVTGLLGRETNEKKNQPLFYIYDDGTVEKRIVIE